MNEHKLFFLPSQCIPRGSFEVHRAPHDVKDDDTVRVNQKDVVFCDDGTLAGDLFSLGIIQGMVKDGKKVIIVCHPKDLNELE